MSDLSFPAPASVEKIRSSWLSSSASSALPLLQLFRHPDQPRIRLGAAPEDRQKLKGALRRYIPDIVRAVARQEDDVALFQMLHLAVDRDFSGSFEDQERLVLVMSVRCRAFA